MRRLALSLATGGVVSTTLGILLQGVSQGFCQTLIHVWWKRGRGCRDYSTVCKGILTGLCFNEVFRISYKVSQQCSGLGLQLDKDFKTKKYYSAQCSILVVFLKALHFFEMGK